MRIILYRSKSNILSTITLEQKQKIFIKNDYLQFQDDALDFWSILFESHEKREQIVNEIRDKCTIENENNTEERSESYQSTSSAIERVDIADDGEDAKNFKNKNDEVKPDDNIEVGKNHQNKANILFRMAKMGRPILIPKLNSSTATEVSDSSDNDSQIVSPTIKPPIQARKAHHYSRPQSSTNINDSKTIVPYVISSSPSSQNQLIRPNTILIDSPNSDTASQMNILLSENRTQNSEIRMNLLKLDTKLDQVLDRCDLIKMQRANGGDQEEEIINLEEKILQLKKENRMLRLQMMSATEQNTNINESNSLERSQELEADVEKYKIKYNEETEKCELLNKKLQEMELEFDKKICLINQLENNCNDNRKTLEHSKDEEKKLQDEIKSLQLKLEAKVVENEELQIKIDSSKSVVDIKPTDEQIEDSIKEIFNNIYKTIDSQLTNSGLEIDARILKTIGRVMRTEKANACDLVKKLNIVHNNV